MLEDTLDKEEDNLPLPPKMLIRKVSKSKMRGKSEICKDKARDYVDYFSALETEDIAKEQNSRKLEKL